MMQSRVVSGCRSRSGQLRGFNGQLSSQFNGQFNGHLCVRLSGQLNARHDRGHQWVEYSMNVAEEMNENGTEMRESIG